MNSTSPERPCDTTPNPQQATHAAESVIDQFAAELKNVLRDGNFVEYDRDTRGDYTWVDYHQLDAEIDNLCAEFKKRTE